MISFGYTKEPSPREPKTNVQTDGLEDIYHFTLDYFRLSVEKLCAKRSLKSGCAFKLSDHQCSLGGGYCAYRKHRENPSDCADMQGGLSF